MDFLKSALLECSKQFEKKPVPIKDEIKFIFKKNLYSKQLIERKNDYNELFLRPSVKNALQQIDEFNDVKDLLHKYPNIKKLYSERHIDVDDLIFLFVKNYIESVENFEFNLSKYKITFASFLKFINSEIYEITYFTPVYKLRYSSQTKKNTFGDILLNQISEEQFKIIKADITGNSLQKPPGKMKYLGYVLETTVKFQNNLIAENLEAKRKFDTFLNAAIIFSSGDLKLGSIYRNFTLWNKQSSLIIGYKESEPGRKEYKLNKNSFEDLKSFYENFRNSKINAKEWSFIEVSINRFSSSMDRIQTLDKIVDLNVALECLFSSAGETSLKITNRTAALIGHDDDEREIYWNFMKNIYKLRNDILHGRKAISDNIDAEILKLENIARKCIQKFLNLSKNLHISELKEQNELTGGKPIREYILEQLDLGLVNRTKLEIFSKKASGIFDPI